MADAQLRLSTVTIEVEDAEFRASGKRVIFPGFFRAYVEGEDDPSAALDDQEVILPPLTVGEAVDCRELEPVRHDTKPPARYTDATLVKALESEGIGRPSTYATIIGTIEDRGYVVKTGKQLAPTFTAFAVNHLMEQHFPDLVDMQFTAQMEQVLDDIAEGGAEGIPYLKSFYLGDQGLEQQVKVKEQQIDPRTIHALELDDLHACVRVGRYGAYLEQENNGEPIRVSLPDDLPPGDLVREEIERLLRRKEEGPQPLGHHPKTGEPIFVLEGPYGPYAQMGDNGNGTKPQRVSLPKGMKTEDVSLEQAIALLDLPRVLGKHPDTGKKVEAGIGRFGPYVRHDDTYRSLPQGDDVLTVGLERAIELLAEKKRRRSEAVRDLGSHPEDGEPIAIYEGRYGPYVKHGKTNASLPKDVSVDTLTIEQALDLLAKKAKQKARRRKSPKTESSQ
jgi:DNA topoisomerase-1